MKIYLEKSIKPVLGNAQKKINAGVENISELGIKTKESVKSGISNSSEFINESVENITSTVGEKVEGLTKKIRSSPLKKINRTKPPRPDAGSPEELEIAIEELKGKDKVGKAGEVLASVGGVAAGVAASGAIASAAGATTILGSTTLAGTLGGTIVAVTPIGWVFGSAVIVGAIGYSIARLVRSGADQDQIRKELVKEFEDRLRHMRATASDVDSLTQVTELLAELTSKQLISESQAERAFALIENGKLSTDLALSRFKAILEKSQS